MTSPKMCLMGRAPPNYLFFGERTNWKPALTENSNGFYDLSFYHPFIHSTNCHTRLQLKPNPASGSRGCRRPTGP